MRLELSSAFEGLLHNDVLFAAIASRLVFRPSALSKGLFGRLEVNFLWFRRHQWRDGSPSPEIERKHGERHLRSGLEQTAIADVRQLHSVLRGGEGCLHSRSPARNQTVEAGHAPCHKRLEESPFLVAHQVKNQRSLHPKATLNHRMA